MAGRDVGHSHEINNSAPCNDVIVPRITSGIAKRVVEKLYGLKVTGIREMDSFYDKNYMITVAEDYKNDFINELWPHGYTLKILNWKTSENNHVGE